MAHGVHHCVKTANVALNQPKKRQTG